MAGFPRLNRASDPVIHMGPWGWIGERARLRVFGVVTLLLAWLSLVLALLGDVLVTPAAPHGIISFELAGQAIIARSILVSWSPVARETAMLIQGLDFLYLLIYPAWFSLAAELLGRRLRGGSAGIGGALSWAVLAAIPLDVIENAALIDQLVYGASTLCAAIAWWCAVPKFALVIAAALFLVWASARCLLTDRIAQ